MSETNAPEADDLLPEYQFDYSKARPNRFASRAREARPVIELDPDVAAVFTSSQSVNEVLRALIASMPRLPARS